MDHENSHASTSTAARQPPSVCQLCWEGPAARLLVPRSDLQNVDLDSPLTWLGECTYTTSWAVLHSRSATGCVWCQFMYSMLGEDDDAESATPLKVFMGPGGLLTECSPPETQTVYVSIDGEPRFAGYVYTSLDDPAAPHIVARSHVRDVGSPRTLALARACIEECVAMHERCTAISVSPDPLLPTLVLDCTNPARPRLAATDGKRGRYLALSYVWGEIQPHCTTTHNMSAYADGIDPARLPQTIRDAIHVTVALGFRYLWADSLCIVQDSDESKRREIGRMHHIYRDAYLTIIAASASRVGEGFLQERPAASRDFALPVLCPSQQTGTVHVSPTHTLPEDEIEQYSHGWDPVSTRGWCLQEYFMSPRALLFTSQTLQFRCQTTTQSVGGAYYNPTGEQRMPDAFFRPDLPPAAPGSAEWAAMYKAWLEIIEDYSRRAVSNPSDKLVACGAIAAGFQRVLRTDYLAGLWRATLLDDLLWAKQSGPQAVRPEELHAPSWSWAAVDGEVWTGGDWSRSTLLQGTPVAEVVRCEVALADTALPFGQVTGGSLVVRTSLTRCVLLTGEGYKPFRILLPTAKQVRRWGAAGLDVDGEVQKAAAAEAETMIIGWVYVDTEADVGIQRLWAAPLTRKDKHLEGLIVTLVDGAGSTGDAACVTDPTTLPLQRKVYRRVGRFDVFRQDSLREVESYWNGEMPPVEIEII
ncbi:HET-domain-containing protein [Trametes versicolor FP-101664 SS1]|uniref:HET-domain-containing protein n=1 Tax=Trametes versicolor (strain FP-101664) TaxID=717944 RepID=UPI0004622FF6|nr:HET-domain-containing protein [Trametes versicolor FP-101664 SS1]EIW54394.1 HET-domain-containing protein [Trametes versicolor FP-101664 SS1]